jgi:hypothetical protein
MRNRSSKSNAAGCLLFFAMIVVGGLVYSGIRFFGDNPNFKQAHAAYLAGNCSEAVPVYFDIMEKNRFVDWGELEKKSTSEKAECNRFIAAQDGGIAGLFQFAEENPDAYLATIAKSSAAEMLQGFTDESDLSIGLGSESCLMQEQLESSGWLTREDTLPLYHYYCSRLLMQQTRPEAALEHVSTLMREFPRHPLTENIWASMAESTAFCGILQSEEILAQNSQRADSLPDIYLACGKHYTEEDDVANALWVYEDFLANYPNHPDAAQVNQSLALLLIEEAKASGSGTIERPDSSGWAPSGVARVVIQNNSPHQLKLVFSGPDARIETLEPCPTCIDYSTVGPVYCPEEGPMETYELTPGTYEVLVEPSDEGGVIPFTGTWELQGGNEFYSCFFVVTTRN